MGWHSEMVEAGYDPNDRTDARDPLPFVVPEDVRWRKGCVVGDPCRCTGAKGILDVEGVEWVWMGATKAYVFKDGQMLHYCHSGVIPKDQDNLLMTPPGEYTLNPPDKASRLGYGHDKTGEGSGTNPEKGKRLSVAAKLRS